MMNNQLTKFSIKVGSRGSKLALVQVDEIRGLLKQHGIDADFDIKVYETKGDRDQKTPLTENIADDFFTDTLDQALLEKEVDITIHSAKDLPEQLDERLSLFALTASLDDTDAFVGNAKFNELKQGARIGTSSALRQSMIKALNPSLATVDIRGAIEGRLKLVEQGEYDGVIVATVALKRLGLSHLIKDIIPWEATPLQGQLAVVGRKEDETNRKLFATIDVRRSYGRVLLVGAGPGDPELMTQKGIRALQEADCVFYDYLINKELLKHADRAEKIYVGKRKGAQTLPQEELSRMLKQKALEGKTVVRLKGGDPLIFGRGADEIQYLCSFHIDVEVVPGVSSATAIPSSLGIPLTARGVSSSVAFLSGYSKDEKDSQRKPIEIPKVDSLVFMMGLTKLEVIVRSLKAAGWPAKTPIIVISRGTYTDEKIVSGTLQDILPEVRKIALAQPALIIVGEIVNFWRKTPGRRQNILYTGTNPGKYKSLGHIVHHPMIEIKPAPLSPKEIRSLLKRMDSYHMILLTSRFGVKHFFELLKAQDYPTADLKVKDFVVIGRETAAALKHHGFEPALVSGIETSQGLLEAIAASYNLKGKKILFPRSNLPNPYLEEELTKLGSHIDTVAIYQNIKPAKRQLPKEHIDKVIFTSPSTVNNFLEDYEAIPAEWGILSRGPLTGRRLNKAGYQHEGI